MKKILLHTFGILFPAMMAISTILPGQTACPGFRTYSQGGWSSRPSGNNAGVFLRDHFVDVFPAGLEIGCVNTIELTSAAAVRAFLPQGGTPATLPQGTMINPTRATYGNVLSGQLVALTLNIEFDRFYPGFAVSDYTLDELLISQGPFMGWSVGDLYQEANKKIGGCGGGSYSFSQFNYWLTRINLAYDNGISSGNLLVCPIVANAAITEPSCFGGNNGSIQISISGGVGPYTYSWSNGSTAQQISGITAGDYILTVYDQTLNTSSTQSFRVSEPTQIQVADVVSNASCNIANGAPDGSITLSSSGGAGAHSIVWADGAVGTSLSGLQAGTYCYTVSDANACTVSACLTVTEPAELIAEVVVNQQIICHNQCNAIITATANGGTAPYSFVWNDGSISPVRSGVCSGDYHINVTDNNGCASVSSIQYVTNPDTVQMSGSIQDVSSCATSPCDGMAMVAVSGGIAPYSYQWHLNGNPVNGNNSDQISGLCQSDSAAVLVTDARGCSIDFNVGMISCRMSQCDTMRTYTQGGWGARPRGNNPGVYLHTNFSGAFPVGISIGCNNTLTLTSAQAVTDFLPSGYTSSLLPAGAMMDVVTYKNVLAAQLIAIKLSVGFDQYDASFCPSSSLLKDQYFTSGVFSGIQLNRVIEIADSVIGGCLSGYALSDLNLALTLANENYDNGNVDLGYLSCVSPTASSRVLSTNTKDEIGVFPNPASSQVNVSFPAVQNQNAEIRITDLLGKTLIEEKIQTTEGINHVILPVGNIQSQTCLVIIRTGQTMKTVRLIIER